MSKLMVTSFFPALCSYIFEPYLSSLFESLLPEDVAEACPEQILKLSLFPGSSSTTPIITIRKPFLAVFSIGGILIGFIGSVRIYYFNKLGGQQHDDVNITTTTTNFYWMVSFFFFGMMYLTALVLHCLLPPTTLSPLEHPFWWIGDTYSAGAFGMSLWAAAMMESLLLSNNNSNNNNAVFMKLIRRVWICGNIVGLLSIVWFLIFGYNNIDENNSMELRMIPGTLPLELWYAGPTIVFAFSALNRMLIQSKFPATLLYAFSLSYLVFSIAAVFDPFFCRWLDNRFLDLLTAPTLVLLATNIIYMGVLLWLEEKNSSSNNTNTNSNHDVTIKRKEM